MNFGGAIGAWAAGFIFDKTMSYRLAFILVIVVCFLSSVFMWIAAPRKVRKIVTSNE
jgi:cyanate permease